MQCSGGSVEDSDDSKDNNSIQKSNNKSTESSSNKTRFENNVNASVNANANLDGNVNVHCNDNDNVHDNVNGNAIIQQISLQYNKLDKVEALLVKEYEKLVKEEKLLREALQQSKESGREKMIRELKEREEDALNRLEEALMMDSSDSSSDGSGSGICSDSDNGDEGITMKTKEGMGGNPLNQTLDSDDLSSDDEIDEEELLRMI